MTADDAPEPPLVKFSTLTVEITQRDDVPNYEARILQGSSRGPNLLAGLSRPARRLDHAESIVKGKLEHLCDRVLFVRASPNARDEARGRGAGE